MASYRCLDEDIAEILFSEEVIGRRIKELAEQILEEYKNRELIWLTVMKGADNFSYRLREEVARSSVERYEGLVVDLIPDLIIMSLFSNPDNPSEEPVTILGPDPMIRYKGREVLVVEDIVDRGLTMKYLLEHLGRKEPAEIKVCSLLSKPGKRRVEIPLAYCGFEVEDKFVVGFGLDFKQRYRELPYIGVLKPEVYTLRE